MKGFLGKKLIQETQNRTFSLPNASLETSCHFCVENARLVEETIFNGKIILMEKFQLKARSHIHLPQINGML